MAKEPLVIVRNHGGWGTDLKEGPEYSFFYSRHIDFRKRPTGMSVLPGTANESASVLEDLIVNMVRLETGISYAVGDTGEFYHRAADGTWTNIGDIAKTSGFGMIYKKETDAIYMMNQVDVARYYPLSGTPTLVAAKYGPNVDQSSSGGSNTYALPNAISEAAADTKEFTPALEPFYSIKVDVADKGTGDWTLTLHAADDTEIGAATILNAGLTNGQQAEFVIGTDATRTRLFVKPNARTYHFHLTSSDGTGTCDAGTTNDLSTVDYEEYAARLVQPQNGMHPALEFLHFIAIGNERYLSTWEPIEIDNPGNVEWQRHRLTFPSGFEVCGLAVWREYLAIACERRSSDANNELQEGRIFLWDGISVTYNDSIEVPEGAPYSLYSHKNRLYWFAGGGWYVWAGGEPVKIRQMPGTDYEFSDDEIFAVNYPYMMAVRNGILLGGFPSQTNSQETEHAVYSFGARDRHYDEAFGYSYTPSHGTRTEGGSNNLRIGMVKNLRGQLFISWRNDANSPAYGIDIVDSSSNPAAAATWESLVIDNGRPDKRKQATTMIVTFEALPSGASITPKYKINRAASWTSGNTVNTLNAVEAKININKSYKEIQLAIDVVAGTVTPVITSIVFIYDDYTQEAD